MSSTWWEDNFSPYCGVPFLWLYFIKNMYCSRKSFTARPHSAVFPDCARITGYPVLWVQDSSPSTINLRWILFLTVVIHHPIHVLAVVLWIPDYHPLDDQNLHWLGKKFLGNVYCIFFLPHHKSPSWFRRLQPSRLSKLIQRFKLTIGRRFLHLYLY